MKYRPTLSPSNTTFGAHTPNHFNAIPDACLKGTEAEQTAFRGRVILQIQPVILHIQAESVFSSGPYSRLCRPALIPERPALMSDR